MPGCHKQIHSGLIMIFFPQIPVITDASSNEEYASRIVSPLRVMASFSTNGSEKAYLQVVEMQKTPSVVSYQVTFQVVIKS